jgi:predicted deacetylase
VPPAWLTSAGARAALAASGLAYTTTHTALVALARPARIAAPCLTVSPRSAWRRAASRLWLRSAEPLTAHLPLLRLGLHPADVAHRELLTCWRALLERLLARRVALTKAQALTHFAPAHVMPASHAR